LASAQVNLKIGEMNKVLHRSEHGGGGTNSVTKSTISPGELRASVMR
jgi:hypothetical protein